MSGHLYLSKKGWRAQVDLGPDPVTGKRRQHRIGPFKTKRLAEIATAKVVAEVAAGSAVDPRHLTFEKYLVSQWLPARRARGLKPTTLQHYEFIINTYVVPRLGQVRIADLTGGTIAAFLSGFAVELGRGGKPRSPRTIGATHRVISMALGDAVRWGLLARNAAEDAVADLPRGRQRPDPSRWWAPDQLESFLTSVRDDRLYALWYLASLTGMRRGELCGVHWDNIDLDLETLAITRTRVMVGSKVLEQTSAKRDASLRVISLDPVTVNVLVEHRGRQVTERLAQEPGFWVTEGHVFTDEVGRGLVPNEVSKMFTRAASRAELPHIRLHELRHSYATAALEAKVDPKVLSGRLGHSAVATTTDIYQHVVRARDRDAAEQVANLIFKDRSGDA